MYGNQNFHKTLFDKSSRRIYFWGFVAYFVLFSLLFYVLIRYHMVPAESKYTFLYYGFLAALASLLIPLGRMILHKLVSKYRG